MGLRHSGGNNARVLKNNVIYLKGNEIQRNSVLEG